MPRFTMSKKKFINQWLRHFAKDVPQKEMKQYVINQYIWHIFSWELIGRDRYLAGDDARRAFDQVRKNDCIFCDAFGNYGVTDKLSDQYDTAEKIDEKLNEFYVVAKDYSWTYIKTHEGDLCGPYFMRNTE